jgi:hypothetical protein
MLIELLALTMVSVAMASDGTVDELPPVRLSGIPISMLGLSENSVGLAASSPAQPTSRLLNNNVVTAMGDVKFGIICVLNLILFSFILFLLYSGLCLISASLRQLFMFDI